MDSNTRQSDTIQIKEAITLIQEQAFAASGMTIYDVEAFYRSERQRIADFHKSRPDYLRSREELLEKDPSLDYMELDLARRFDTPVPGLPYQHPYLYAWLQDMLQYGGEKLGWSREVLSSFIIATAPTGRFNAIAIPGQEGGGMLIEDGLFNVSNRFSNELAYLLYDKLEDGRFIELHADELGIRLDDSQDILEYLADVIWEYIVGGYSTLPGPIGDTSEEDFSIRHILSQELFYFVIEHERFHLQWWRHGQLPGKQHMQQRCDQVWDFYVRHLMSVLPEALSPEAFRRIYFAQQEELLADFFAFSTIMKLGKNERTFSAAVKGGLLFFLMAGLIEHLLFQLEDPGFTGRLYTLDGMTLSLTAIVTRRSHPYAWLRQQHLMRLIGETYPQDLQAIQTEGAKLDVIGERIRSILDQRLASSPTKPAAHPKWKFGQSAGV